MPLRLRLLSSAVPGAERGPERAIEFSDGTAEIRIGRRPDLELPLPDRALSALHARLVRTDDGWRIEDLGSTNGTRVDGERLPPNAPRPLTAGAQITLGQIVFAFDGTVAAVLGAEGTATIARRLVGDLFAASPGSATPTLSIVTGVRVRPPLRLEQVDRRYVIGRVESCDLQLGSEEVSREHAEIVRLWDQVVIGDLGSKNGVRVNDVLLTEQRRLRDGDRVQIGPALLRLSDPADRYLRDFEARAPQVPRTEDEDVVPLAGAPSATESSSVAQSADANVADAKAASARPPAPAAAASLKAPTPTGTSRRPGGSRTAMVVAAIVLLAVAAVIVLLASGG
jgi:pSer/pThr/pTyr-binding forkhead associated (FHA) protein